MDPLIKSWLLYQLSYAPGMPRQNSPGAGLAKAPGSVQPWRFQVLGKSRKSRRIYPAASWTASRIGETALDTARFAKNYRVGGRHPSGHRHAHDAATYVRDCRQTLPFAKPGKHHETMLLRLVEALVEWPGCVGKLLQSAGLTHHIGAQVSRSIGSFGPSALARATKS